MIYTEDQIEHLFNCDDPKLALLIEFQFFSGTQRVWNGTTDIPAGEHEWLALKGLANVEGLEQPLTPQAIPITFTLGLLTNDPDAAIELETLALGSQDEVAGRQAIVYDLILDDNFEPVGNPIVNTWSVMRSVSVERSPAENFEQGVARIARINAENQFFAVGKRSQRQYTDRDQQNAFPGDRALEHISNTKLTRNVWPEF